MRRLLALPFLTALILSGCGAGQDSGDTKQAAAEVQSSASQGGPKPSSSLPPIMAGGPGAAAGRTGKFGLGGKTGK